MRKISLLAVSLLVMALGPSPATSSVLDQPSVFVDPSLKGADGKVSVLMHVAERSSLSAGLTAARGAGFDPGSVYEAIDVFVAYGPSSAIEPLADTGVFEGFEANQRLEYFTDNSHKATRGQDLLDGALTLPDGTKIDGSGVGVAVVDSGVDGTHPDLDDRLVSNLKVVCTTPQVVASSLLPFETCRGPKQWVAADDTDTISAGGHGTHVAGIVAGTGAQSGGRYHGAAPGASLYGLSVGTLISVENGLDGLEWVLENHDQVTPAIKVVNNSWGSSYMAYGNRTFHGATWDLQEALIAEGVTVVFAAGNSGGNGSTPTTSAECINPTPGLICVANYDDQNTGTRNGTISGTSSRGSRQDPKTWPDIAAPGTQIMSTCRATLPVCTLGGIGNENFYRNMSGTSMAAPHVAGIIAQILQINPALTPAQIENLLEDTAHKFAFGDAYTMSDPFNTDDSSSFEKGHGLVDALAAVTAAGS